MKTALPLVLLGLWLTGAAVAEEGDLAWPALTRQCKPWAYHWWLGSAVDRENLGRELDRYREGGLGGIHIVPIYGAEGAEERWVPFLSAEWTARFDMAVAEAEARDLGVDLTTGTGWCFGGPSVPVEQAGFGLDALDIEFPADGRLPERNRRRGAEWKFLQAVASDGERVELRERVDPSGRIPWRPEGESRGWRLVGVSVWPTGIKVKRAAPGGEGFMLNPFFGQAMRDYLAWFGDRFDRAGRRPRAMYHDSFEYFGAAWAPDLPAEFARRRGYPLEDHWETLAGHGEPEEVARVWHDYRQTLSDLVVEKVFPQWTGWCRARGMLTRNQTHGEPGNLLDFYALADIPETEMFNHGGPDPLVSRFDEHMGKADRDVLVSKFASSAAHVAGRPLASAETGTWLAEHFHETFEELKCLADRMFAAGINHVFYHGCVYSPDDAPWPGWLFYASTQMNPRNPLWREAPALNAYIARVQSVLQSGRSDNDVLFYWPVCDAWMDPAPGLAGFSVHRHGWAPPLAYTLADRGFALDYISDRQVAALAAKDGALVASGGAYRTLLIPASKFIPLETLEAALKLAEQGATVCLATPLATDVPGLARLDERRAAMARLHALLGEGDPAVPRTVSHGEGDCSLVRPN